MKGFYLLSCVCIAMFVLIESQEPVKKYAESLNKYAGNNACQVSSGITPEFLLEYGNKTTVEIEAPGMAEVKHKLGCYLACLLEQKHLMSNNKINADKFKNLFKGLLDSSEEADKDKVEKIMSTVNNCIRSVENLEVCDVGWTFCICMGEVVSV